MQIVSLSTTAYYSLFVCFNLIHFCAQCLYEEEKERGRKNYHKNALSDFYFQGDHVWEEERKEHLNKKRNSRVIP